MSFDDIGDNTTRWLYILINGFNDIDDNATRWLCVLYTYIYNDFIMMICYEDMVMLRSTTDPLWMTYDRGRIWGDDIFTPPRLYGR